MNCENKELFRNHYNVIPYCWPQCCNVQHWPKTKSTQEKFFFSFIPNCSLSPHLSLMHFLLCVSITPTLSLSVSPFFFSDRDLEGIPPCVCSHRQLSPFFSLPSLPLFSLAGSVSLPRDSPLLCSRYRPIDFGRERKYCGHDSPCMNLMIPALSVPSFQWRRKKINHKPFLSPSLQACQ